MATKKKKEIERICNNCKLFDPSKNECAIVILHEGQRHKLPVLPQDSCFFEGEYFDPNTKAIENFAENIQEVKFWVEDAKGDKTSGNGTVKVEYPEGFFGTGDEVYDLDNDADLFEYLKALQELKHKKEMGL